MTEGMTRKYPRRTISLSPEADEALGILMEQDQEPKASRVVDSLLRSEMGRRGFTPRQAEKPVTQIDISTSEGQLRSSHHDNKRYVQTQAVGSYWRG